MDTNYKKASTTDAKFSLNFGMYTYSISEVSAQVPSKVFVTFSVL
jgi:hypothetical protein